MCRFFIVYERNLGIISYLLKVSIELVHRFHKLLNWKDPIFIVRIKILLNYFLLFSKFP